MPKSVAQDFLVHDQKQGLKKRGCKQKITLNLRTDLYTDFVVVLYYQSSGVDVSSSSTVSSLRFQDKIGGYFHVVIATCHVPRAS